jgi:hypothetical protein
LNQLRQQSLLQDEKMQVTQQRLAEVLSRSDEVSKLLETSREECDLLRQQVSSITAAKDELAKLYAVLLERYRRLLPMGKVSNASCNVGICPIHGKSLYEIGSMRHFVHMRPYAINQYNCPVPDGCSRAF